MKTTMSYLFISFLPFVVSYTSFTLFDISNQCEVVHGGWSEWSCFGGCSVTCGQGYQKLRRHCNSPTPKYGGRSCEGKTEKIKPCEAQVQCPVDGGWGGWHKGECSKSCGTGHVASKRQCNSPEPKYCGKPCEGESTRTETCNNEPCAIDGGWSEWKCGNCFSHKTHGECVKKCTRECSNPLPQHGGRSCIGKSEGYDKCDSKECPNTEDRPCEACHQNALNYERQHNTPGFVGHACRVNWLKHCENRNGGINQQYPSNNWFFLACSGDGAWCKPCATRNLVYNPTCGQCEATAHGKCTGPNKLNDGNSGVLDFIDEDALEETF